MDAEGQRDVMRTLWRTLDGLPLRQMLVSGVEAAAVIGVNDQTVRQYVRDARWSAALRPVFESLGPTGGVRERAYLLHRVMVAAFVRERLTGPHEQPPPYAFELGGGAQMVEALVRDYPDELMARVPVYMDRLRRYREAREAGLVGRRRGGEQQAPAAT